MEAPGWSRCTWRVPATIDSGGGTQDPFIPCPLYVTFPETFRLEPSFPAKARSSVVFPDPGGPNSNVILERTSSCRVGRSSRTQARQPS